MLTWPDFVWTFPDGGTSTDTTKATANALQNCDDLRIERTMGHHTDSYPVACGYDHETDLSQTATISAK